GVEESLPRKAHESDRTAERGWRAVLVTVEVWALAGRRHWPAVRAELAATPGQLASIAAGAMEEAATDVAASARTLRDLVAWSVWATVWAYRSTGGLLRTHWPGVRRRLVTLARATAVLVARGVRRAGHAAGVAVLLAAAAARATASFLARRVPEVLAAVAAVAVATGQRGRMDGCEGG